MPKTHLAERYAVSAQSEAADAEVPAGASLGYAEPGPHEAVKLAVQWELHRSAIARARGRKGGRPRIMTAEKLR